MLTVRTGRGLQPPIASVGEHQHQDQCGDRPHQVVRSSLGGRFDPGRRVVSRDDADRAVGLEHGEPDVLGPDEAVRADRGANLLGLEALLLDGPWTAVARHARAGAARPRSPCSSGLGSLGHRLEAEVQGEQRHDRDEAAPQRRVLADHRVLDRVADDEDDHQLEDGHLAHLALARQAQGHDDEEVDDGGPQDHLGERGADLRKRWHRGDSSRFARRRRCAVACPGNPRAAVWADDRSRGWRDPPQRVRG